MHIVGLTIKLQNKYNYIFMKYLDYQGTTSYAKSGVGVSWNPWVGVSWNHTDIWPTDGDQLYCYTFLTVICILGETPIC